MYVHRRNIGITPGFCIQVISQLLARMKFKKGALFRVCPGMTNGADVEFLLAGECLYRGDIFGLSVIRMRLLPGDMGRRRAMTTFTIDTINNGGAFEPIGVIKDIRLNDLFLLNIRSMTFETLDADDPSKPDNVGRIVRAAGPGLLGDEIRYRQLEDRVLFPI